MEPYLRERKRVSEARGRQKTAWVRAYVERSICTALACANLGSHSATMASLSCSFWPSNSPYSRHSHSADAVPHLSPWWNTPRAFYASEVNEREKRVEWRGRGGWVGGGFVALAESLSTRFP